MERILALPIQTGSTSLDNIDPGVAEMDRIYAQGLGEIRKLAEQTQTELAERMGIKQAAVSRIESRDDLLLSTLALRRSGWSGERADRVSDQGCRHRARPQPVLSKAH